MTEKKEFLPQAYKPEKPPEQMVLYEKVAPNIATVTLNRPEKHNCIYPPDMILEIGKKMRMGIEDQEVKVIILKGNGPSFCSGDDLNVAPYEAFGGRPGYKPTQRARLLGGFKLDEAFHTLDHCPKIVIGQAKGWAVGIGLLLLRCCDIVIAADTAKLAHREQRIAFAGLLTGGGIFLDLLILGPRRTREWLLTGRKVTAQEAKEWGWVNAVVPEADLEKETMRWAETITLMPGDGLVNGKIHYNTVLDTMGYASAQGSALTAWILMQNLRWGEDEMNFLKLRTAVGPTQAFKTREERWAELGF